MVEVFPVDFRSQVEIDLWKLWELVRLVEFERRVNRYSKKRNWNKMRHKTTNTEYLESSVDEETAVNKENLPIFSMLRTAQQSNSFTGTAAFKKLHLFNEYIGEYVFYLKP